MTIVPDQLMVWGGSDKPCGTAMLMSIGCLGVEENKKHAAVLYPLLEKELGIPGDRFVDIISCLMFLDKVPNTTILIIIVFRLYITFSDQSTSNVGYTGTTFKTIFG